MASLVVYLGFSGKTREAMDFYKSVFGGELYIQSIGESPMAQFSPAETHDSIMHADLKSDKVRIMASDQNDPSNIVNNEQMSLCLVCESDEEIQDLYNKLMEGGNPIHPVKKEFFGWYGDGRDKFGIRWMFQFQ